jgi:Acetyltransferase (GNAT) domain
MSFAPFCDEHIPLWREAVDQTGVLPSPIGGPEYASTMIMFSGKTWIFQSGDLFIPFARATTTHFKFIKADILNGVQINSLLGLESLNFKAFKALRQLPGRCNIRIHVPSETYKRCQREFNSINFFPEESYPHHRVILPSTYDEWYSRKEVKRQNIRRAHKSGVTITIGGGDLLEPIHKMYMMSFQKWKNKGIARNPHEYQRFQSMFDLSGSRNKIALAYFEDKVIAGAIFCHYGHCAAYLFGGSDPEYQNLRANNLLHSEIIRFLISHGIKEYDMGISLNIAGLEKFKESLGAEENKTKILLRHRFPLIKRVSRILPGRG